MFRPIFYLNDDVTIRSILKGTYSGSPDGHAVYMKYPLTGILSWLYQLLDTIPWLELFLGAFLLWAAYECITKWKQNNRESIFLGIPVGIFICSFYMNMHYTVVAAVVVSAAIVCICAKKTYKPIFLWLIAWMIRSQVAYLALPFIGVAFLWRTLLDKEEKRKRNLYWIGRVCGGLLVGLLLCMGMNRLAYQGENWQKYLQYNEARTQLFDYTDFHSTDEYSKAYEEFGMTEEEFQILNSYNTMLDGRIETETLLEATSRVTVRMESSKDVFAWVKQCILKYYYEIRYSDNLYAIIWISVLFVLVVNTLVQKEWRNLALIVCLEAGRSLIWIFLLYQGRFPERVSISLYVMELALLGSMLCINGNRLRTEKAVCWQKALIVVLSLLLLLQLNRDLQTNKAQVELQKEWTALSEYCKQEADCLYLIDVFSVVQYGGLQYQEDTANMMLAGGWMTESPLAKKRFENIGVADGAEALYENKKVRFIAKQNKDVIWIEEYLNQRFGDCTLEKHDVVVCGGGVIFEVFEVVK